MSGEMIKSGKCDVCGQMVYVVTPQITENGEKFIHWLCKEENREYMRKGQLKNKLHKTIDVMSLSQLEELYKTLFNPSNN